MSRLDEDARIAREAWRQAIVKACEVIRKHASKEDISPLATAALCLAMVDVGELADMPER